MADATKSNKIGGKKVKLVKNTNIYPIQSIVDTHANLDGVAHISLCVYRINIKPSSSPFLQYLLFKNKRGELGFPGFNGGSGTHEFYESIIGQKSEQKPRGFLRIGNVLYVFYQYINIGDDEPYKTERDEWWWCLMDEICNWRKVIDMDVDPNVVKLFYERPELIYLYDTNYNKLEIPVVGYHGESLKSLEFIYTFGVKESDIDSKYGPHYYYTTFERAFKYGDGVIRAALFMNDMKVFVNHPLDPVDNSEYAAMTLKDIDRREKMRLKLRMVDYDAKWVDDYDSVYAGRALMDNGEPFMDAPEMVVKHHSQQVMLSIHVH